MSCDKIREQIKQEYNDFLSREGHTEMQWPFSFFLENITEFSDDIERKNVARTMLYQCFNSKDESSEYTKAVEALKEIAKLLQTQNTAQERYAFLVAKDTLIQLNVEAPEGKDNR